MNWRISLLLAGSMSAVWATDVDSVALLARVQSKVRDNARRIPRYVCLQKIERTALTRLAPNLTVSVNKAAICWTLPDKGLPKVPSLSLIQADRAHLDVMLAQGTEFFSWPGGRSFDTSDPGDLLGGGLSGSGDFAGFVISVFTGDEITFEYLGSCPGSSCVRYRYDVPLYVSHYLVKSLLEKATVGYHGTFDVDPQSAELVRMTVTPTELSEALPEACDIRTRMTYIRTTMQAGDFMIPESTEMEYLDRDGSYSLNRVSYEGCRQYTSESVLTFGDDSPKLLTDDKTKVSSALPVAGSELTLRLASKIDSEHGSAGDNLEATLVRAVQDTEGGSIPAATIIRGHLAELQRVYFPRRQVVIAIRFDTIVLNGSPIRLILEPIGKMDQHGRGIFSFPGQRVVVDRHFVSRWRVRSPAN